MVNRYFRAVATTFVFIFCFAFTAAAQTVPTSFPNVNIKNFGQMDEKLYRGAQPQTGDYKSLKELGIKTIVDLRNDPTEYEKTEVEALGMKYVNIPMSGWKYPKSEYIQQFLSIMNDAESGPVFIHCKAGIHRTGVAGAVYRFTKYGWDYDKAYREMKNYNFSSGLVHGPLKRFVIDYSSRMNTQRASLSETGAAGAN